MGGYVFWVSPDGKHGLVSETEDLGQGMTTWYEAQNAISNPSNHSINGQKFRDWRLPTLYELNEMYAQKVAIGGFGSVQYWSSTESDNNYAWFKYFLGGGQNLSHQGGTTNFVRAVRAF